MTLQNDDIFKYITIKGDEYILKDDAPKTVKKRIKDYIHNVKRVYDQVIVVRGLDV